MNTPKLSLLEMYFEEEKKCQEGVVIPVRTFVADQFSIPIVRKTSEPVVVRFTGNRICYTAKGD